MLKRFMFASIGVLALAAAFHLGATYRLDALAEDARVPTPTEVAILTGTAQDGETIALPEYADGTPAQESECRWMVSLSSIEDLQNPQQDWVVGTTGRVVTCRYGWQPNGGPYQWRTGVSNYMIIATRPADRPISRSPATWAQVKHRAGQ